MSRPSASAPVVERAADESELVASVLDWYDEHARDLPWRAPGTAPYAVLVSEVMLQQTPVSRVLPAYHQWLQRWPTLTALAQAPAGEAVRQWGRLGYPRRALRLHAAARVCVERYGGELPRELAALRALPGVGDYTAAAVASFAFGGAHAVLDTNVRRVLGRVFEGVDRPSPSVRKAEVARAEALLPDDDRAPRWSVAVMELGALVCTARSPSCAGCPVTDRCRWLAAGSPRSEVAVRRQRFTGTDRQARGALLAVLRADTRAVSRVAVLAAWPDDPAQAERALQGLIDDGLVISTGKALGLPA